MKVREIEKLSPELLEELVALDREAFGAGAAGQWTLPMLVKYGKVFILEEENRLLGLAYLVKGWNSSHTCCLHGFSVHRDKRGQGLSNFFMEGVLQKLKKEGIRKIRLTVSPENEVALALYHHFNFRKIEYSQDEYGLGEDRLVLELKLSEREGEGKT